MLAAGARGLQTVISIQVQPTEDLLTTTLHLNTDSPKSTKIQKIKEGKKKKKNNTEQTKQQKKKKRKKDKKIK